MAVIEVRNLRKTYSDGTHAVKDVSFRVEKGEIFGFLGPNGAGKTTTMRILGTLHHKTAGEARVLGLDVGREARALKRRIGFAMQEVGMDDLATAEEMLVFHGKLYGLGSDEAHQRAGRLLKLFDLAEHADRRVVNFSGGMQRRLDLAVSIIHSPEVLFLDEPSTGLDPTSRSTLWAILRRLRKDEGLTILMSTHYMDEADALCDRIAIIHNGRIAAIDTPGNLKRSIGSDTLRIAVASPLDEAQRKGLVSAFGAPNVVIQDGTIDLRVKDGGRALMPALQRLSGLGLQVRETKVLTPTLEDVFLRHTGSRFDETQAAFARSADKAAGKAGDKDPGGTGMPVDSVTGTPPPRASSGPAPSSGPSASSGRPSPSSSGLAASSTRPPVLSPDPPHTIGRTTPHPSQRKETGAAPATRRDEAPAARGPVTPTSRPSPGKPGRAPGTPAAKGAKR